MSLPFGHLNVLSTCRGLTDVRLTAEHVPVTCFQPADADPLTSPTLSCLDYWYWRVALDEVVKWKPDSLAELSEVISFASFAGNLDSADVVKAARHACRRAEACLDEQGVGTLRGARRNTKGQGSEVANKMKTSQLFDIGKIHITGGKWFIFGVRSDYFLSLL